jgi:O-glycosyl hydrolase
VRVRSCFMPTLVSSRASLVAAVLAALAVAAAGCGDTQVAGAIEGEIAPAETPAPAPVPVPARPGVTPSPAPRCPAPVVTAAAAPPGRIVVTSDERQTIAGWGASVVTDTYVDPLVEPAGMSAAQVDAMDRKLFREARIDIVRVFGPGFGRAKVDAAPRARAGDRALAFMRRVAPYGVKFMFTGAKAPRAMMTGRKLRPGAEAAYAAWVAEYLRTARFLGAPFSYAAAANEPENRASRLQMTPAQSARVYAALAGELAAGGPGDVRLVLGDTTGWGSACPFAVALTAQPDLPALSAAVATHPYFGSLAQARGLAERVREAGLDVWQTEFGTGCATCPDRGGVHEAIDWSAEIAAGLDAGRTSAWFTFRGIADSTHGPGDALLVRERRNRKRPFYASKRFHVFRQYSSVAPPGSSVLAVAEQVPGLIAVAVRDGGRRSLVVTNTARAAHPVELDLGSRAGALSARRTSFREDFRALPRLRYRGRPLKVALPAESVTTFTLSP